MDSDINLGDTNQASGHVPVEQQVRQFVMQSFKFQSALNTLLSRLKKFFFEVVSYPVG